VDIFETPHAVVARVEITGVAGEDIHVNVEDDLLRVSGVRRPPVGGEVGRLHQMEIAFGSFERKVRISIPFDRTSVSARLEDGFLSVTLPKKVAASREVKVETE
jgi:HSP20 family protein